MTVQCSEVGCIGTVAPGDVSCAKHRPHRYVPAIRTEVAKEHVACAICGAGPTLSIHNQRRNAESAADADSAPDVHRFFTGAVRGTDCDGLALHLLPPAALRAWARAFAEGEKKYGAWNWEKGIPATNLLNHLLAHLVEWLDGNEDEDHLGHALWNLGALVHSIERWPHLNEELEKARTRRRHERAKARAERPASAS